MLFTRQCSDFISDEIQERLGESVKTYGPDRLIMCITKEIETGKFYVYDKDGTTILFASPKLTIRSGDD
jgi:hypothetical protein